MSIKTIDIGFIVKEGYKHYLIISKLKNDMWFYVCVSPHMVKEGAELDFLEMFGGSKKFEDYTIEAVCEPHLGKWKVKALVD